MRVLVFDTETTGLPLRRDAAVSETELWPHVVQLSYILYDTSSPDELTCEDMIIRLPATVPLPQESISIHGITRARMNLHGIPIADALDRFDSALQSADVAVAHNLPFDKKMLMVEARRLNRPQYFTRQGHGVREHCTMRSNRAFCNIVTRNRNGESYLKNPKLVELHEKVFGETPGGLHDSMADVLVCLRCYIAREHGFDPMQKTGTDLRRLYTSYCR